MEIFICILWFYFQLKKLLVKVISRDVLYYRKLTDVPIEDKDKIKDSSQVQDVEVLAMGKFTNVYPMEALTVNLLKPSASVYMGNNSFLD